MSLSARLAGCVCSVSVDRVEVCRTAEARMMALGAEMEGRDQGIVTRTIVALNPG